MARPKLPASIARRLARNIRAARLARGVSLAEMAFHIRRGKPSVSNMERFDGAYPPSLDAIFRIREALRCSWEELLGP